MKKMIQSTLKKVGLQLKKYPDVALDSTRRMRIARHHGINILLDIGANTGQYANSMRELGYAKKIISFEPQSSAFQLLQENALKDNNWEVRNYAIGDEDTKSVINIANNSFSSSLLNMLPEHLDNAPESKYVAKEEITVKKLDSVFHTLCSDRDNVMMKIDTQGYEKNVIDGATESLKKIKIIQLEMSIVPLYEDEMLFVEMIEYLKDRGFGLFSLENGFSSPNTGQLLQVDGIFVKNFD